MIHVSSIWGFNATLRYYNTTIISVRVRVVVYYEDTGRAVYVYCTKVLSYFRNSSARVVVLHVLLLP